MASIRDHLKLRAGGQVVGNTDQIGVDHAIMLTHYPQDRPAAVAEALGGGAAVIHQPASRPQEVARARRVDAADAAIEVLHLRLPLRVALREGAPQQRPGQDAILLKLDPQRPVPIIHAAAIGAGVRERGDPLRLTRDQAERRAPPHRVRHEMHPL